MSNMMDTHFEICRRGHGPEMCVNARKHTDKKSFGYIDWHDWAEQKSKTHTQYRCPTCGFWVMWKKKPRKVLS